MKEDPLGQDYQCRPVKAKYDEIRCKAQLQHSQEIQRKARSATVYAGEYRTKQLDESFQSTMRPSSPTRMNKPHPPEIFLITTLHNLPGYYNCNIYKNFAASHQQSKGTHSEQHNQVHIFRDANSNIAAQAWLSLASDKDREAVKNMIRFVSEKPAKKVNMYRKKNTLYQAFTHHVKPEFIASAQQWLMGAGTVETAAVERLLQTLSTAPQTPTLKSGPSPTCGQHRAEYVIHPEWKTEH
ncbi:uncharacterized protein LOC134921521 isoform X2 [Pseudophryne corroboree]|uniref:uncharacterized protein LOC134921521 isoform X2 n=1 Tax=Pseudophryne corroboree TaxID=495146 RepID=UPI00308207E2